MKFSYYILTLFLVVSLSIASCSDESFSDEAAGQNLEEDIQIKAKTVKYVPYKESGTLSPTTDPSADLGVECTEDLLEIFNEKSAKASHMGKIGGYENSCVNFET